MSDFSEDSITLDRIPARAASPSGPREALSGEAASPAAGLPTRTFADAIRAGWHSPDMCSPAAGLDPDLAEQAFKNLGLWGDYPEWTKTRREYAEKFASEYDRIAEPYRRQLAEAGAGRDRLEAALRHVLKFANRIYEQREWSESDLLEIIHAADDALGEAEASEETGR